MTLGFGKPTIRAFGKLPIAGDFLSYGAFRGVAEEWRNWMSAAFADEVTTSSRSLTNRIYRFWYRGDHSGLLRTPVAGFLMDSADRLGRRFPFSWYTTVSAAGRGGDGALRGSFAAWGALAGLLPKLSTVESADDLYKTLDGAPLARLLAQEPPSNQGSDATIGDVLDALFAGDEEREHCFLGRLQRIFALSESEGAQARVALRLPMNSGYSSDQQALAWLRVLDCRPGGAKADAPNVLVPGDRRSSDPMLVFLRDLDRHDGRRVFVEDPESAGLFDLTAPSPGDSAEADRTQGQAVASRLDRSLSLSAVSGQAFWG